MRKRTLLLWGGFFTCLMASYTIFSWVPTMLHTLGFNLTMTSVGLTTFNTGGVIGALFSGVALDRKGFSVTHLSMAVAASILATGLALLLSANFISAALILPMMLALGFCMSGLHNTLYTLAANTYPAAARATGVGVASAVGRLGAVLSSFTGVVSLEYGASLGFFGLVAILLFVCGIAGWATRVGRAQHDGALTAEA
jgi:AAHS family 4-hydroxybenzoate transporter-like MFS transporter